MMVTKEVLVNEPVSALIRVMPTGEVRPTSFLWRDKTRYVDTVGRTWEERIDGRTIRCYLIQSVDQNTFELRWDAATDQWTLHRAWLRAALV
jgi:esterase/lipase superfamily enzyme